ncbi:MAG: gamma-glutamyl kinase [Pseudomonadota bacterium]
MLVFWAEKLVMLAVPKTGTTALQGALAPRASIVLRDPPQLKHSPVARYKRFLQPMFSQGGGQPDMETFAMVRDPVDWLCSWYRYRSREDLIGHPNSTHGINFDDFVVEYCKGKPAPFANVGSQAKFLTLGDKSVGVTHLYKYEAMASALTFLCHRLSKDEITLKQKNVSPSMEVTLSSDIEARLRSKRAFEFEVWSQGRD